MVAVVFGGAERNCAMVASINYPAGYFTDQPPSWTSLVSAPCPVTNCLAQGFWHQSCKPWEEEEPGVCSKRAHFQGSAGSSAISPSAPSNLKSFQRETGMQAFQRLPSSFSEDSQPIWWRWPRQSERMTWAMITLAMMTCAMKTQAMKIQAMKTQAMKTQAMKTQANDPGTQGIWPSATVLQGKLEPQVAWG